MCTLTLDDGTVHLVVTAERSSPSHPDPDDPGEHVSLVNFTVQSRSVY
jgi:hypothetical protein